MQIRIEIPVNSTHDHDVTIVSLAFPYFYSVLT